MSAEVWVLAATAVLAVVAIGAAVVAVRAARRIAAAPRPTAEPAMTDVPERPTTSTELVVREAPEVVLPTVLEPRVVEGRVVVPPTQQQVVAAAMGRPAVRLSILTHGLAHALRPESRDRITSMMRREYRRRRRERLRAGRQASRAARPTPPSDQWMGS